MVVKKTQILQQFQIPFSMVWSPQWKLSDSPLLKTPDIYMDLFWNHFSFCHNPSDQTQRTSSSWHKKFLCNNKITDFFCREPIELYKSNHEVNILLRMLFCHFAFVCKPSKHNSPRSINMQISIKFSSFILEMCPETQTEGQYVHLLQSPFYFESKSKRANRKSGKPKKNCSVFWALINLFNLVSIRTVKSAGTLLRSDMMVDDSVFFYCFQSCLVFLSLLDFLQQYVVILHLDINMFS